MIGVLALQGNFREHINKLKQLKQEAIEVRLPEDLDNCDGLIIPGGESTTISKLLNTYKLDEKIKERHRLGMKIMGTCAGAILLARNIIGNEIKPLRLIDLTIERNAYGRQLNSFESEIEINYGDRKFKINGIFIRAPVIRNVKSGCQILAVYNKNPVVVKQGNILVTTFHPELTRGVLIHSILIDMTKIDRFDELG